MSGTFDTIPAKRLPKTTQGYRMNALQNTTLGLSIENPYVT